MAETEPELWLMGIIVQPAYRGHGIGNLLYQRLLETLCPRGAKRLLTRVYPHQLEGLRFLAHHGFQEHGSSLHYQLNVAAADTSHYENPDATIARQGLRFATLDRFPRQRLAERLLPIWNSSRPDQPQDWPFLPYTAQRLEREMLEPAEVALNHSFVIIGSANQVIALALNAWLDKQRLGTIYLGVDPAFRRRGLATTLKLKLITHAQTQQIGFLVAENDASNTAMRAINTQLGYRHLAELVVYQKLLD